MIYMTDGSFEGILTAVFEAFRRKECPEKIASQEPCQLTLGTEIREIETDREKSDRVYKAIVEKMSREAIEILYRAYLSEHPDVGTKIYDYIKIGLKIGGRIIYYLQDPDVLWIHDRNQKVLKEVHLFLGILRFRKLRNGIYYAEYEPDNNITMLISGHFEERLSNQPWIIHDAGRDIYALYNTNETVFLHEHIPIPKNEADKKFEVLWKGYFQSTAIENRLNPNLQRRFMPRRYWKNLIEKQNN